MRRSGLAIIIILIVIAAVVVALTHKTNNSPQTSTNQSQSNDSKSASNINQPSAVGKVNIRDMMFTPSQITIAKGGTVTWTNNDNVTHTVVDDLSNVGGPNSSDIAPGQTYSFTFTKTGSFQYHCSIHPSMRGTIVVK